MIATSHSVALPEVAFVFDRDRLFRLIATSLARAGW
jgi:hypothetical protein